MEGEVGLVAGRSQREKRRSYKDLLREEEEIDAQVRKTSKKRRDSDPFAAGNELHKKKKRTHEDENYHHKEKSHGQSLHHKKKKKKTTPEGRSSHMSHAHSSSASSSSFIPSASHTASTETAMDLLQAITSPLATGSDPSPPHHHQQHHHQPYKKSSNTTHSHHHHHHTSSQRKQQQRGEDWDTPPHAARPRPPKKKPPLVRETLPVVGTEVELEGHYDGPMGIMGDSSSSAEELEDGELIIDDSYAQLAKKAKKSKKSKKKKEKEKDKEKERDKKHSQKGAKKVSKGGSSSHSSGMANGGAGYQFGMADSANHRQSDEKKKKEKKAKPEKDKKRRTITAYQVFCKEYRASINEEQPGLDFGELAKRLGDAWNQLPEGDKEVWKERAQYLQAKADLKSGMSSGKSVSQSSSSAAAKAEKPKAVKRVESRPVLLQTNGVSALEAESAPSPGEVPEVDPIDAAAHLQLLGESLSVIGCRLQETEGMVTVSGSLSVLLDAMLCALGPLACLTAQVPELNGCPQHILSKTLDNIAYVMPGL